MKLTRDRLRFARSTRYLSGYVAPGTHRTPEQILDFAESELRRLGYRIVDKQGPKGWKSKRMTTTLKRTVYRGVTWNDKTLAYQAATTLHELGHARQMRGIRGFLAKYVFKGWFRACVEFQMYRQNAQAFRAMGLTEAQILAWAKKLPDMLIKSYWITGRRLKRDIRRHMVAIVMLP